MKHFNFTLIFLFVALLFCTKCTKSKDVEDTRLQINVKDHSGNSISGATVTLTDSPNSLPGTGVTQISDANGIVTFLNPSITLYYVYAEKGCRNNINNTTYPHTLTSNILNVDSAVVNDVGILKVVNNSSESYSVTSSIFNITLPGNNQFITHLNAGPYTIHSEKISTPGMGRDTLIQFTCGDTSFITLPY